MKTGNGSSVACGIQSYSLDKSGFNCTNIGNSTVTLTAKDVNGNSATATATVKVEDNVAPKVSTKNITVQLLANGTAAISADQINNGSSDACGIQSYSLDKSGFNCSNIGENTVTLTVTDLNGNSSAATAKVKVEDKVLAVITGCPSNFVICSSTATWATPGATDNCGAVTFTHNAPAVFPLGPTIVTYTATDASGNTSSCSFTVTRNALPVAGIISGGNITVCSGNSVTLTLSGNTGSIQWQSSTNNSTFANIGNATGQTYTAGNITGTRYFRAVVTTPCSTATSTSVQVSVGTLKNPASYSTTNITSNSATLNWVSAYNPASWQVEYKSTSLGSKWKTLQSLDGSVRTVVINGLGSNQAYQWHIRAKCGKSWTAYSAAIDFKTTGSTILTRPAQTNPEPEIISADNFTAYPNPTNGIVNLNLQLKSLVTAAAVISLTDIAGRTIYKQKTDIVKGILNSKMQMPASAAAGMYIIRVVPSAKSPIFFYGVFF